MTRRRTKILITIILAAVAVPASAERRICYKTTSLMWDASAGSAVPTSPERLKQLQAAFQKWEEASAGALRLDYAGFSAPSYDGPAQIPFDGCIHAVLYGQRNFHGELGHGRFNGKIPDDYKRGYFFLARDPDAFDGATLVHEIGHTLGLMHAAVPMSIMFSGPRIGGRSIPAALYEQDAADLRTLWTPGAPGLYTISGQIDSTRQYPMASVFATNADNGRAFSARTDHMGRFTITLLAPGRYTVVAKPITVARDLNPGALGGMRASWFVSDAQSAPERKGATVLTLSASVPAIAGLRLRTFDEETPVAQAPHTPAANFPVPVIRPGSGGGAPPVIHLSFDKDFNDDGPLHIKGKPNGDGVRLVPGVRGQALSVGGTEDWLDLTLSTALPFDRGFTLELWFRRADWLNPYKSGSGWQTLAALTSNASLSITAPGCPTHKPWALQGAVSSRHAVSGENVSSRAYSEPGSVQAGKWTHAAMTYDWNEKSMTVYLDGIQTDKAFGAPDPDMKWGNLRLGTWHKANQAFRGEIDEVAVYDYSRSAAMIAADAWQSSH